MCPFSISTNVSYILQVSNLHLDPGLEPAPGRIQPKTTHESMKKEFIVQRLWLEILRMGIWKLLL